MVLQNEENKDDKLVVKETQDLERFKQRFFISIDKAQEELDQLEAERKFVLKHDDYHVKLLDIEYGILTDLIKDYNRFVHSYVLDLVLFKWPKSPLAKKNPEILSKLCMILFSKRQEIQLRLAQIIPPILYNLDNYNYRP
jgi:hypothetical protein